MGGVRHVCRLLFCDPLPVRRAQYLLLWIPSGRPKQLPSSNLRTCIGTKRVSKSGRL